ncbi:flavin reductase family protein [Methylomonas sp. MgM2]
MTPFPLPQVYQLLEPGPVVLLTTADHGHRNAMALSWYMMVEFEPPMVACVVSSENFSFTTLRETGACVIAIPTVELAEKVVAIGNTSGRDLNKFRTCGLTPVNAEQVAAPLIAECFANLECKVVDASLIDKYNMFVLEVVRAWTDPEQSSPKTIHHQGYGRFVVDGESMHVISKMR